METPAYLHLTLARSIANESPEKSAIAGSKPAGFFNQWRSLSLLFLLSILLSSLPAFALQKGDRGSAVGSLQRQLQTAGYFKANITDYYGPITEDAVRAFQRSRGLTVDGIAGTQTLAALGRPVQAAPAVPAGGSSSVGSILRNPSRGAEVTVLQNQLRTAGYYSGPTTGYFGSLTEAAVRRFQAAKGLTADGIYGSRTRSALLNTLNNRQQGSSVGGGSTPSTGKSAGTAKSTAAQRLVAPSTTRLVYGQTLKKGSSGAAVTNLQNRLRSAGYYGGPITGYYGELTRLSVRKFQLAKGLSPDGVAGPNTLAALVNQTASASQPSTTVRALAPTTTSFTTASSNNFSVLELQRRLKNRGFDPGPLDGKMGPLTNAAIAKFQQARGISRDDIIAGRI